MDEAQKSPSAVSAPPLDVNTHFAWMRTRLSIDRTFLAWTRTATSLIGFGFTIYQFLDKIELGAAPRFKPDTPRNFGLAFIATGLLAMAIGWWQHQREIRYLGSEEYTDVGWRPGLPQFRGPNLIALVVSIIGLVTFVVVLLGV